MKIVNSNQMEWESYASPTEKFSGADKDVSIALGRDPNATDLNARHPFDVEITKIPPGASGCPYHSHSAQWEFYHVISGKGCVRHAQGRTPIEQGDAFIFKPHEPHQIINDGGEDLVYYVVADNPIGEAWYYPDSNKWGVTLPERRFFRGEPLDYFDGEE